MNRFYTIALFAASVCYASASEITDVISASTISITDVYAEQQVSLQSAATYLVTLKDDGNGPQFKAGSSGIVTCESGGKVKRIEVAWGSKSNEDIEVYGQHTPYAASNAVIGGMLLGTIEFSPGATTGIDIDGEWEYIGITTTAKKGKAAQFGSLSVTWETPDAAQTEPCEGVIISEVCGDDGTTEGHEDWIEIFNPTDMALDLSGVQVQKTDEDGVTAIICTLPDGMTLPAEAYLVLEKGTDFTAGISNNKNVNIALLSPLGIKLNMFDKTMAFTHNGSHPVGGSYSLDPETGLWCVTDMCTKGIANVIVVDETDHTAIYKPVTGVDALTDGLQVILVNKENGYVMSYEWDTTKDSGVYLYGYEGVETGDGEKISLDAVRSKAAVVTLVKGDDGTWALKFGDTNNYLNDSRFLACTAFKKMDFKKNDDPTKGTRATITFNPAGDAEIDYGAGGVVKFNLKTPTTSRFFNYDPTDKPEDHLAVTLYTLDTESGVASVASDGSAAAYYNLQGMPVVNPHPGQVILIKTGNSVRKAIIRL